METEDYVDALERDGALLADAAQAAGLDAAVPPCPPWQVRDLLRHQAYVHAWAARHVRDELPEVLAGPSEAEILGGGPPDADLLASYRRGHADLVAALRAADPAVACATFMPAPSPLAFWARRQAHETAIHRYDAQAALPGGPPEPAAAFETGFAADGIDELIMGFAARRRYRLRGDGTRSLTIRPADAPGGWQVRLADGVTTVSRPGDAPAGGDAAAAADGDPADGGCVLDGPAACLYAFLWNRRPPGVPTRVTVTGDPAVLALWSGSVRVTW